METRWRVEYLYSGSNFDLGIGSRYEINVQFGVEERITRYSRIFCLSRYQLYVSPIQQQQLSLVS